MRSRHRIDLAKKNMPLHTRSYPPMTYFVPTLIKKTNGNFVYIFTIFFNRSLRERQSERIDSLETIAIRISAIVFERYIKINCIFKINCTIDLRKL